MPKSENLASEDSRIPKIGRGVFSSHMSPELRVSGNSYVHGYRVEDGGAKATWTEERGADRKVAQVRKDGANLSCVPCGREHVHADEKTAALLQTHAQQNKICLKQAWQAVECARLPA